MGMPNRVDVLAEVQGGVNAAVNTGGPVIIEKRIHDSSDKDKE